MSSMLCRWRVRCLSRRQAVSAPMRRSLMSTVVILLLMKSTSLNMSRTRMRF